MKVMANKDKIANKGRLKAQATVKLYRYIQGTHDSAVKTHEFLTHLGCLYEELEMSVNFSRELTQIDTLMGTLEGEIAKIEDKIAKISLLD